MPPGIFTGLDGGASQEQLTGQPVTHRRKARPPEPGPHRIEAAACQVETGAQERVRRAAIGKRGDQFLSLACLACLQVPAGGSRIDQVLQGGPRKMRDERASFAQGGEHAVEIVQRSGDPCLLEPEQDLVDAGKRLGQKDLLQALERRDRVRELVAVDENSGQRKMGVKHARVGVDAERVSRLQNA